MSVLKFINQDLRRRSFDRQPLQEAVFSHCDLRGCNFHQADLQGASFVACRLGPAPQRWTIAVLTLCIFAGLSGHAVSSMLFGALGTLAGDPAWPYVRALYGALEIAAVGVGAGVFAQSGKTMFSMLGFRSVAWIVPGAHCLTGLATGALLGFFYGGSFTDNNPVVAVVSAVISGLMGIGLAGIAEYRQIRLIPAGLQLMGAICTYGLAFGLWTIASAALTTGALLPGLGWGAIALGCVGIALKAIGWGVQALWLGCTTSFRQANLTGCTFMQTSLKNCDFREVQGRTLSSK